MDEHALVSVIMAARNAASTIVPTVRSLQQQTYGKWELIVVDDGSTDGTASLVETLSSDDSRIQLLRRAHSGLTNSLNVGCEKAKGPFIARMDCGDASLPLRFEQQLQYLHTFPEVVAVGCGARRVTSAHEVLGMQSRAAAPVEITRQLTEEGRGILHPASMFRRDAFMRVGGYRPAFRFAQDTDLWLRLSDNGLIGECPEILFELRVDDDGISATRIEQQRQLWKLALDCHRARRRGESEAPFLQAAATVSQQEPLEMSPSRRTLQRSRARYFIGSQLYDLRDPRCRRYLLDSLRVPSLLLPSAAKILMSFAKCRRQ